MAQEKKQSLRSDELAKATAEANGIFARMGEAVEQKVKEGVTELDVL